MLKRYGSAYFSAAARSLQALPSPTVGKSPDLKLITACIRSHWMLNASRPFDARVAIRRHYAAAAETARDVEEDRPSVTMDLTSAHGGSTTVEIRPSYPHKPKAVKNLLASLPALLTDAAIPVDAIDSFATKGWDLDESGDTIHRYVELVSEQEVSSILNQIKAASHELNHDPHIHADGKQLTISCTTHVPPGLSMKDVKLASKINDILTGVSMARVLHADEADILTQRQRGREHNMEAIQKAKLDCGCG